MVLYTALLIIKEDDNFSFNFLGLGAGSAIAGESDRRYGLLLQEVKKFEWTMKK